MLVLIKATNGDVHSVHDKDIISIRTEKGKTVVEWAISLPHMDGHCTFTTDESVEDLTNRIHDLVMRRLIAPECEAVTDEFLTDLEKMKGLCRDLEIGFDIEVFPLSGIPSDERGYTITLNNGRGSESSFYFDGDGVRQ